MTASQRKRKRNDRPWRRRQFVKTCGQGLLLSLWPAGRVHAADAAPALPGFDEEVETFMRARGTPGGALAVVRDRRLVQARGYGWADKEQRLPARPDSLFRIASLSKPITAVAVLKLAEQGKLRLDDRAFDYLDLKPVIPAGTQPDPRLRQITIHQLLHHTGGWDRDRSFDPMFRSREIAQAVGRPPPADARDVIRYMLGQPLNFDPGTRYAYSNFGYCVLGRVIERVAGMSYEQFVKENILAPIGIRSMRIGATLASRRAEGEVRYYTPRDELGNSVFTSHLEKVPRPYGAFCLEAMDAHGGWLASAVDLARFAAALDDAQHSPLLKPASFQALYAPPPPPVSRREDGSLKDVYYGCGWSVRPIPGRPGKANYWHAGSLPGTYTLLVRRWDGLSWAVLFNQRQELPSLPDGAIDPALHRAANAVRKWPETDLFPKYK